MNLSEYKLVSPKIKGEIVFTYNKGVLFSIVFKLAEPLSVKQFTWLVMHVLYSEKELNGHDDYIGDVKLQRITPLPSTNKVELFSSFYKRYVKDFDNNPVDYVRSRKDHLMIRGFEVTEALLIAYFTSDKALFKGNYSIGNYCKFFNQLRAEAAGANKKQRFPNYYDPELVKRHDGQWYSEYCQHLLSLGKVPKKSRFGDITDFIDKDAAQ